MDGHGSCLGRSTLGLASDVRETCSTKPLSHSILLLVWSQRPVRWGQSWLSLISNQAEVQWEWHSTCGIYPEAKSGKLCATRCESTGLNFPDACVWIWFLQSNTNHKKKHLSPGKWLRILTQVFQHLSQWRVKCDEAILMEMSCPVSQTFFNRGDTEIWSGGGSSQSFPGHWADSFLPCKTEGQPHFL